MFKVFFQEAPTQDKKPVAAKTGSIPAAKTVKADSSSESSSEEDSSSDEVSNMHAYIFSMVGSIPLHDC